MIPKAYIDEWRQHSPWQDDYQVEQDLIISRSLIELFSDEVLREHLAFRGGTALYKLYSNPAARYSEDIDLVQIHAMPFGAIMDRIKERLSFLGVVPVRKQKEHNNTLVYRIDSENGQRMKLKIEVNTREHFTVFGYEQKAFNMVSAWYTNETMITTFQLEELLGTKLRALYQRKKGRDLFDFWFALTQHTCDTDRIVHSWKEYMQQENHSVSRKEFEMNLDAKMQSSQFLSDIDFLLRPGLNYNITDAIELVKKEIIEKI